MLATTQPLSAASLRGGVVPAEDAAAAACDGSFLEELEIEYNDKVAQMRALTQRLGLKYESEARMELLKLPLAVRSMTVGEFCDECGGDATAIRSIVGTRGRGARVEASARCRTNRSARACLSVTCVREARDGRDGRGTRAREGRID